MLPRLEFQSDVRVICEKRTDGILISTTDIETVCKTGERNFVAETRRVRVPFRSSLSTTIVPRYSWCTSRF